jgi:hypothetical protein
MEQVKAVVPLALYLGLFQVLILRQIVDDSWLITAGLFGRFRVTFAGPAIGALQAAGTAGSVLFGEMRRNR